MRVEAFQPAPSQALEIRQKVFVEEQGFQNEFEKILVEPCVVDGKDWMKEFVYASHLVKYGNKLRLYFNARNAAYMLRGRECIGFAEAEIK